jgi:hypothetical protein
LINKLITISTIFLLYGVLALGAAAQENTCELRVNTFSFQKNSPIGSPALTLTRLADGQPLRSGLVAGRFENISSGKYKLQVEKDGYSPRVKEFEVNCNFVDGNGVVSQSVYLGDPRVLPGPEIKDGKGTIKGIALYIPKPAYPDALRGKEKFARHVTVQILIDEDGNVISGNAVNENSLLGEAAVRAAMNAKFQPTRLSGAPVKVSGIVSYDFVP